MSCFQTFRETVSPWFIVAISLIAVVHSTLSHLQAEDVPDVPVAGPSVAEMPSKPITEAEATLFADGLAAGIKKGDVAACEKFFDWSITLENIIQFPASAELDEGRKQFRDLAMERCKGEENAARMLVQEVSAGGTYKCIRLNVNRPNKPYVIFRLTRSGVMVRFHYLFLARGPDGSVVASDMFDSARNLRLSEFWRENWDFLARDAMRTPAERLLVPRDPRFTQRQEFLDFCQLAKDQKFVDALASYQALPEVINGTKTLLQ
jgi:hypothetical protein